MLVSAETDLDKADALLLVNSIQWSNLLVPYNNFRDFLQLPDEQPGISGDTGQEVSTRGNSKLMRWGRE